MAWEPIAKPLPDDIGPAGCLLIYSPLLAADDEFPGHAIQVSNPAYVRCGNAQKHGYTQWCLIPGDGLEAPNAPR